MKNFQIQSLNWLHFFYKKTALIKPDFYIKQTDMWIEFFWEVDIQIKEER